MVCAKHRIYTIGYYLCILDHLRYGECLNGRAVTGAVESCRQIMKEDQDGYIVVLDSQKCS